MTLPLIPAMYMKHRQIAIFLHILIISLQTSITVELYKFISYGIMGNKPLLPIESCFSAKIKGGINCDKIIFYCLRFYFG